MICFLGKATVFHGRRNIPVTASQSFNLLYIVQNDLSIFELSSTLRFISTSSKPHSFTVSYLIKKCGLSPETASRASNVVRFESPERPDTFIAFLENHGFSKTQITNLIRRKPALLLYNKDKILLPKFEFLYSKGFTKPDLAKLLSTYPTILTRSLQKQIIPSFNFLRDLLQSDEKAVKVIKRFTGILTYDFDISLLPNMKVLRENGVSESYIHTMLQRQPRSVLYNPVRFKEIVEEIKGMGIDSSTMKFVEAAVTMRSMTKSTLEKKFDVYRTWGWSDQQILEAFQKLPTIMSVSEDKIMATMDFLVNKMGYSSSLVVKTPNVLRRSLKKRVIPRALFAQELLSRGFIKDPKLSSLFDSSDEKFTTLYVNRHLNKAPELMKIYGYLFKKMRT